MGEGDYAASKSFLKDQASFVEKNKANIPAMGKAAEKALEGPEGDALRDAEAAAAATVARHILNIAGHENAAAHASRGVFLC